MAKKKAGRGKSGDRLRALMRTQEINELLSKSITESEALQNSGDDRPVYESHVTDLLANQGGARTSSTSGKGAKKPSRKGRK